MDPRTIWRSIAYKLAELDRGVKLDILEVLSGDDGHAYPEDAKVEDQFCKLIFKPLYKHFPAGPTSSRSIVVVIDALDECDESCQEDVQKFLSTIVEWSEKLSQACKLVVTSRTEAHIVKK